MKVLIHKLQVTASDQDHKVLALIGQMSCDQHYYYYYYYYYFPVYLVRDMSEGGYGELCESVEDHSHKGQGWVGREKLDTQFPHLQ